MKQEQQAKQNPNRYIKLEEVIELTSLSANTIRNIEKQGRFPKGRKMSIRAVRWFLPDVLEWMKNPEGWKAA